MKDRVGNILENRKEYASKAIKILNAGMVFATIFFVILLMSNTASAANVTYYLNATRNVNIGADGVTNVTGANQVIPDPQLNMTITALMDKTGNNSGGALTNDHPHDMHIHSRWYFTSNNLVNTIINANPAGKVFIYASSGPYPNLTVRLFDYYPSNGSKTLIGSSLNITLSGGATNTAYSYTISSSTYIVPANHRLMLQFDFDPKTHGNTNERVYANKLNSYLIVNETPITYNISINSTPSTANIPAGTNVIYNITVNNSGNTNGNYSLSVSDSNTLYFRSSVLGNSMLFVPAGGSNQTTLNVSAYEGAPKDEFNTAIINATSIENPVFTNITQTITTVTIPITYNVIINSTPLYANVSAGANVTYNITVNNTGTTDGNYTLSVSDSDTTNFSASVLGMTPLFVPAGGSNQTTLMVTANGTAPKDTVDTTTITATSIENSDFTNTTQITTTVSAPSVLDCTQCHASYSDSVMGTKHNQTKNPAAPTCTTCHKTETLHTGFIVNESNTCRNCHVDNVNGFKEAHTTNSSDCTMCHFANTTIVINETTSLYLHDHNLTVEHSYYEYTNGGGMPLAGNLPGTGVGMFPQYTCSLTCHAIRNPEKVDKASSSWLNSSHANSRFGASDSKNNCAKCKSPTNYNDTLTLTNPVISDQDWDGIQCRVCHNLHNRSFSNLSGNPAAFYNATASSYVNYSVYDKISNNTELCEKCHEPGSSHDSKFSGTHKNTLNFTCTSCHMNASFSRGLHDFQVKNTTSGITGCEVCHNLVNHSFQFTSQHTGKVDCIACHDQTFTTVNATGYAVSNDNYFGLWKETPTSNWTTAKKINSSPATWPLHNISKSINCNKCHGATSVYNGTIAPALPDSKICAGCHLEYSNSVLSTKHNTTINVNAPECTGCHTGYEPVSGHISGNKSYTVNESNTCRNCHIDYVNGFREAHTTNSSDCTMCHFANTTVNFSLNTSLKTHDHNLTVEHSYYEYTNGGGMPFAGNVPGTGVGMFPQYTCSLTCHAVRNPEKVDKASSTWLNSSHANSRFGTSDSKNNCAKCKSPTNYNDTLTLTNPVISVQDWEGIQCRVCHNLHDRNVSGINGYPVAFYNATASTYVNYSVYEPISNNTELCGKCHEPGSSHDSKFEGTHKNTLNFTCTSCHMNASFSKGMHDFQVKNTTSGITGCEVCHNLVNHSFQFTSQHTGKVDCIACHDQTFTTVNSTGYAVSSDNYFGLWKENPASNWTTAKKINTSPVTWPLHNISKSINCIKCHGAQSVFNGTIAPVLPVSEMCAGCHFEYSNSVLSTKHNATINLNAPECTGCHTGYEPVSGHTSGNKSFTVNESNTCRNCHIQNESGFFERHTSSSDCTACHFANTTRSFDKNTSLFTHDHNLTVERNFYQYNNSGMPIRTNNGTGVGMFPYYTCTLTCHKYNATTEVEGKIDEAAKSWLESAHAQSLHMSGDNKQSCSKCKSPANFNVSANQSSLIDQADWQGIQCRTCHNLHDRKFPNNTGLSGFPIAFYNSTASSLANYPVYEQVANVTVLCQNCHSGTSHDSKFAGTHKDMANFTCINCHMNSSFNNELHKFEVKNTTSNVTGCEVCHKQEDHSVLLCKGKIDCVGCHDQTVQRNSTGYAVSPDNKYGIYNDTSTGKWTTYKESKGYAVSWPLHNISKEVTCEKCKGTLSVYSGEISKATGTFCERCHYQPPNGTTGSPNTDGSHDLHKAKGYSTTPETGCDYCHSTGGRNESGHPGTWNNADVVTNGSESIGVYVKNNATGSDDTCGAVSCHSKNLTLGARVGNSTWNTSTAGLCNQCHSTQTSGSPPTGNHTKHFAQNVTCSTCHGNNSDAGQQGGHRDGQIEINLTKLATNGSYISGTCTVYCHDPNPKDLNSSTPTWNTTTIVCGSCHTIPPTIFKTRNGNNHPEDPICDDCHGAGAGNGTHPAHRNGAVDTFELKHCLSCHEINGSAVAKVDSASFGMHKDLNNTDGGLTFRDCMTCHFNITGMFANYKPLPGINVYVCRDCHVNQTVNSTKVAQHIPGSNLSVNTMNCEDCHVNSINIPDTRTTINNTLGKALHYGTRTNLLKPTAGAYNTACNICHNSSVNNITYGAQNKQIYMPHTATAKCNMCHIPSDEADTLHNSSLSKPDTVSCKECHIKYASKYKASNISGTFMDRQTTCNYDAICHPIERDGENMDTLARHNINMTMKGIGGTTDTVYLNGNLVYTVNKGTSVVITSKVNDSYKFGGASRVGGAEYYIDIDPGEGQGIPMQAVDGFYDALDAKWENVTATLDTSNLSNGEHKIFVRGVDIGNQWSSPKNATLTVQSLESLGYININSNVPGSIVFINGAINTTDSNGNYLWGINGGIYNVTVSKDPAYYANTTIGINVTANNITNHNVLLTLKPFGTISGLIITV